MGDYSFSIFLKDITAMGYHLHLIAGILLVLIAVTVIGNALVVVAIIHDSALRTINNYLVGSLAMTDLLVGLVVMPIGAVYEVSQKWSMGPTVCDLWLSADVLCCTASILHLAAIAFDRYLAVTNINYIHHRTGKHVAAMIICIWLLSAVISFAPILGWKDSEFNTRLYEQQLCLYSQNIWYQLFATLLSFYVPVILVLFLYYRIYQEAKKRFRRRSQCGNVCQKISKEPQKELPENSKKALITATASLSCNASEHKTAGTNPLSRTPSLSSSNTNISGCTQSTGSRSSAPKSTKPFFKINALFACFIKPKKATTQLTVYHKSALEVASQREKRAATTLMIITGVFVVCWLPFFVLAILISIFPLAYNRLIFSICLWLGWINSMINPIIYTIFSPDFRKAFRKVLHMV